MLKKLLLATAFVGSLSGVTLAQTRAPATMTTIPSATPQEFDLLDSTGKWMPFGTASGGAFQGTGGQRIFGVDPTGAQDATSVINAALASNSNCWFLPKGAYKVTDALVGKLNGCLVGDSSRNTILAIDSTTFNMSALGAIVFPVTGGQSFTLRDIGFEYTQPQTSVRANIVSFPPAVYAQNAGRFVLQRIYFGAPNICLDARGNAGGAFIDTVECGALSNGMLWDGSLDSVRINNWHNWTFGNVLLGASPLFNVWTDGNNNCATLGRIDDLDALNWTCQRSSLVVTANATTGGLYQKFVNLALDGTGSNLSVAGGRVSIVNGYSTSSPGSAPTVNVTGGALSLINFTLRSGTNTVPAFSVTGGAVVATSSAFVCGGTTASCVSVTGGGLTSNDGVYLPAGSPYTAPYLYQSGGYLALYGGAFTNLANGVGVQFSADTANNVIENVNLAGWGVTLPTPSTAGQYGFYIAANNSMTLNRNATINGLLTAGNSFQMTPANPTIQWKATGAQATDQHNWDMAETGVGDVNFRALNDAFAAASTYVAYTRGSGYSLSGAKITFGPPIIVPSFAIAALPACSASLQGANAYVTNGQASPPYLGAVSATGAVVAPVFCNGANWVYH